MNQGLLIARLAGVRIRAHWSVLVIAGLLTWGLGVGIPVALPGTAPALAWITAAGGAILLIASLTAHELAHSIVARRRGVQADDITLWVFGGVSHIKTDWQTPRTELLVSAAGPLVTLVVAAVCFGLSFGLAAAGAPDVLVLLLQWLAVANALILVLNLVPAFPLDGGRILRSALWERRHDRSQATITAARIGRAFGFLIVGLGMLDVLLTADFGGLWLMLIGWFIAGAARTEQRAEAVRASLAGAQVAEVMSINPTTVPSWVTVDLFLKHYAAGGRTAYPTNGLDGRVDGLVTVSAVRRVPSPQRSTRRLAEIFIPVATVPAARPDELVTDVLTRVGRTTEGHAFVFDGGRLVGVISPADIGRRIQFGVPKPPPLPTHAPGLPPVA